MDKIKTLQKRKTSLSRAQSIKIKKKKMEKKPKNNIEVDPRDDVGLQEYNPADNLLDVNKMGAAIMQCLIENDTEGALEIIENYLYALNKTQFFKEAKVPRSTVYNFFKRRNPTIKTLAKILYASAH